MGRGTALHPGTQPNGRPLIYNTCIYNSTRDPMWQTRPRWCADLMTPLGAVG